MTYAQFGFLTIAAILCMCTFAWLYFVNASRDERRRVRSTTIRLTVFAPFGTALMSVGAFGRIGGTTVERPEDYIGGFFLGIFIAIGFFGTVYQVSKLMGQRRAGRN